MNINITPTFYVAATVPHFWSKAMQNSSQHVPARKACTVEPLITSLCFSGPCFICSLFGVLNNFLHTACRSQSTARRQQVTIRWFQSAGALL